MSNHAKRFRSSDQIDKSEKRKQACKNDREGCGFGLRFNGGGQGFPLVQKMFSKEINGLQAY